MEQDLKKHRDLVVMKQLAESESDPEKVLELKRALKDAGYNLFLEAEEGLENPRSYCDSSVCAAIVCAFSSTCDGGACASNGCSALVDHCAYFTSPNPCEGTATCTNHACGTGASDNNPIVCANGNVCSTKSKG